MKFTPVHYLRVAFHFWPWERAFWLGLFHDSIEDGWMTKSRLEHLFGRDFGVSIALLSRPPAMSYAEYIGVLTSTLLPNDDEIRVKRADLAENYARAPASLRKRYAKAMAMLA